MDRIRVKEDCGYPKQAASGLLDFVYNCFAVHVRDPACVYKLAKINNVATVYMGHAGARSSARTLAESPLTKLAIKSLVSTAKSIHDIHL